MESIFHVRASTAEELRAELLTYLDTTAKSYEAQARSEKRVGLMNIAIQKSQAIMEVRRFWAELHIDPKGTRQDG